MEIVRPAKQSVRLPRIPDVICISGSKESIPLADLSDDELQAIGEEWTRAMIRKAHKRREESKGGDQLDDDSDANESGSGSESDDHAIHETEAGTLL